LPGKPRNQPTQGGSKIGNKTQPNTPRKVIQAKTADSSPSGITVAQHDLAGLHLDDEADEVEREREKERYKEKVGLSMKQEELIAKVKQDEESGKLNISLIVVGASFALAI
jgi:elongation factor 1 alpha-like protein